MNSGSFSCTIINMVYHVDSIAKHDKVCKGESILLRPLLQCRQYNRKGPSVARGYNTFGLKNMVNSF